MPQFMDTLTRSRWNFLGTAVDGPLEGEQLEQLPGFNSMWFAWDTYYRGSDVWDYEGIISEPPPITAVEEDGDGSGLPESFALSQNYPNPFNPSTIIQFALPEQGVAHLKIFNAAGQEIRSLMEGGQSAGFYMLTWDGRDASGAQVSSGSYVYRLTMPETGLSLSKAMTLVK